MITFRNCISLVLTLAFAPIASIAQEGRTDYEIVIYGGTSGGVAAAVQAARMGRDVVLIQVEPRLGGLSSGGLGQTDIGRKSAIGGISREFYERIADHYAQADAWPWQDRSEYRGVGRSRTELGEQSQWTFEPHVAEEVFESWAREADFELVRGERLDLKKGVEKTGKRITALRMESGRTFRGSVFIDATYEGDLLPGAGVSYVVGREGNSVYGETLNGVQVQNAHNHNLANGVDPYVRAGDPASGLLPGIDPDGPGEEGEGDNRVQAYCYRMCLTDHPENRIPFARPEGYDEATYELLFRNLAIDSRIPWINSPMPNRKTDTNNCYGVSTDFIGQNYEYPEGDYETRETIALAHRRYQEGLMWTLANHPRVPEGIRTEVSRWGLSKDEFQENGGWPEQLYIREARRLVGEYVMTQHNCQGREVIEDSVGMAAYTMDSHNTQRYVNEQGFARNEGNVEVGRFPPYPISYRAITPKREECENLLVPVCLSASHIAFGSIRMEPVFMVLGQSSALAAILAIEADVPVQEIDYDQLRLCLLAARQVLK